MNMYSLSYIEETAREAVLRHLKGRSVANVAAKKSVDEFDNPVVFIDVTLDRFDPVKDVRAYRKIRDSLAEKLSAEAFPIVYLHTCEDASASVEAK